MMFVLAVAAIGSTAAAVRAEVCAPLAVPDGCRYSNLQRPFAFRAPPAQSLPEVTASYV